MSEENQEVREPTPMQLLRREHRKYLKPKYNAAILAAEQALTPDEDGYTPKLTRLEIQEIKAQVRAENLSLKQWADEIGQRAVISAAHKEVNKPGSGNNKKSWSDGAKWRNSKARKGKK